ncbi:MAG: CotH kinase family protein [Treponema sp.]|nr:CotH kinase family protein [Treponema sp.]
MKLVSRIGRPAMVLFSVLVFVGTVLSCDVPVSNGADCVNGIGWTRPVARGIFPSLFLSVPAYEHGGFEVRYRPDGTSINVWPPGPNSSVALLGSGGYDFVVPNAEVRSRGNSTWRYFVKRPLRIRLSAARHIFGSEYSAANWTLIANALDYTLMRTYLAYFLSESLDRSRHSPVPMFFTPMRRMVHLYMAGEYRGLYLFSDQIDNTRIGLSNQRSNAAPHLAEYLIEWCRHNDTVPTGFWGEALVTENQVGSWRIPEPTPGAATVGGHVSNNFEQFFWTNQGIPFEIAFPETAGFMRGTTANNTGWRDGTTPQSGWAFVRDFVNLVEQTIRMEGLLTGFDEAAVRRIIDVPSFVDFYLMHEFFKNHDVAVSSVRFQIRQVPNTDDWTHSTGATRPKLFAGPMWDFDQSAGASSGGGRPGWNPGPTGAWAAVDNLWLRYLMGKGWFRAEVRARWNQIRDNEVQEMLGELERVAVSYQDCFERNFERWDEKLGRATFRTPSSIVAIPTWRGQVEYLNNWFHQRVIWMDGFLR